MTTFKKSAILSSLKLATSIFLVGLAWAPLARSQSLTWQAIPFQADSSWPGPFGSPATITPSQVVLNGQPVRSVQSYTGPLGFSCDATLTHDAVGEGGFWLSVIPTGQPTNLDLTSGFLFDIGYGDSYGPQLELWNYATTTEIWSNAFPFSAGTTYHMSIGVAANGLLSLNVDGTPYVLPNSATLGAGAFQLQMQGWQPSNTWTAGNFAMVPEPSTVALAVTGLLGLVAFARKRRG